MRWLRVDAILPADLRHQLQFAVGHCDTHPTAVTATVSVLGQRIVVEAGRLTMVLQSEGELFGLVNVKGASTPIDIATAGLFLIDSAGVRHSLETTAVFVVDAGPVVVSIGFTGRLVHRDRPVGVEGLVECFAGSASCVATSPVRNPSASGHPSGKWDLGAKIGALFRGLDIFLPLRSEGASLAAVPEEPCARVGSSCRILQESSGGDRWNHHTHLTRDRSVALRFRGSSVTVDGELVRFVDRSAPVVAVETSGGAVAAALPEFWQQFPNPLEARPDGLTISLLSTDHEALHELQGGEQKTRTIVVGLAATLDDAGPLTWVVNPTLVHATPEYYSSTGVVPGLTPKHESTSGLYETLIDSAIQGPDSFEAKREVIDEYGWRHYGDIYGDHEAVFYTGPDGPLVLHYNNQYDPVHGMGLQFLRSGDVRWWRQMDALARHVIDIDVYHTDSDKAAYNQGLFWHTAHYVDADTSTHRTYPTRGDCNGGGPSGGHLYTSGLVRVTPSPGEPLSTWPTTSSLATTATDPCSDG